MSRTDSAAFAALLNELKTPLAGAAATISRANIGDGGRGARGSGEEGKNLKVSELSERFEHLNQVLPDMLRCLQEVKSLQSSVAERVAILERRQETEEGYLQTLQEHQEAIQGQSAILQQNIKDCMAQLRQVLNEREYYLLAKVKEIEAEKLSVIDRQRQQCTSLLEGIRAADRQARQTMAADDFTIWLDHGRDVDQMLAEQNELQVDYGPPPDLRFNCTLTVDLQRRILEVIDFDERKGAPSPPRVGGAGASSIADSFAAISMRGGSPPPQGSLLAQTPAGLLGNGDALGAGPGSVVLSSLRLPDGTDYASFRRKLLAESSLRYHDPPLSAAAARDPAWPPLSYEAAAAAAAAVAARAKVTGL